MKKIKTKILIGFGVMTTLATTGSIVLSCGNNSDQGRLNAVTATMVADYVKTQDGFIPSATADVPTVAHSTTLTNATLNGVGGLTIAISNWVANATLGSVTFDVSIFKILHATRTITKVSYDGWKTDQGRLNAVTADIVADYVKTQDGFIPSATVDVPTVAHSTTLPNVTLNGLSEITITISNWVANSTLGSVTFDVSLSKTGLTAKSITGVTYDGWRTSDQQKLNTVTADMVADYVKTQDGFIPSADEDAPAAAHSTTLTNATLNGLGGLTITISSWVVNSTLGSVTFNVSLSKTDLTAKSITGVTYGGWITNDQKALNVVTTDMVADYVETQDGFIPSPTADAPTIVPHTIISNAILNGVSGLTITISNWVVNNIDGSVTFNVTISRTSVHSMPDLKAKSITGVTYDGWKTDQDRLEVVTAEDVANYVKKQDGFIPSPTTGVPTTIPTNPLNNATLNGADGLTITISNWTPNDITGSVTFDVSINKTGLHIPRDINGVTYDGWKTNEQITNYNVNDTEGKLWSFDDSTKTLNIFNGVTNISYYPGGGSGDPIVWGAHDITSVAHINFSNTLTTIGDSVFKSTLSTNLISLTFPASLTSIELSAFTNLTATSLTFLGDIPGTPGKTRTLKLGDYAFYRLDIKLVIGGDWREWIEKNWPSAFKPPKIPSSQ